MKIYDNQNELVLSKDFSTGMLDLKHVDNQGDSIQIPIINSDVILHMKDVAWSFADSHDWIAVDSDKTKTYLYIQYGNEPTIMIESYPYLPNEHDMKTELDSFDDEDERDSVQGYYEEIRDYLNDNNCGEFDCIKVEFSEDELDFIQSIADKLFNT